MSGLLLLFTNISVPTVMFIAVEVVSILAAIADYPIVMRIPRLAGTAN